MSRKNENTAFRCENCEKEIAPVTNGSYRNHCPYCLYSKHLDNKPGDRISDCHGLMKPVQVDYSAKKGYIIIHRCFRCGKVSRNKLAVNTIQEDQLMEWMQKVII